MTTTGNGSAGASLGVLAEITGLLAAITPEQFTAPPVEQKDGDHIVAVATDDVKRLFTLRDRLIGKCNEFMKITRPLSEDLMMGILINGQHKANVELNTPGSPMYEAEAKLKRALVELQSANSFLQIVDGIFWLEVRRQHPDLEDKSVVGIRHDWSLLWREEESGTSGISIKLVAGGSLDDLAEMLGPRSH